MHFVIKLYFIDSLGLTATSKGKRQTQNLHLYIQVIDGVTEKKGPSGSLETENKLRVVISEFTQSVS